MQKNLRPQSFKDYVGQQKIKNTLKVIIHSAKQRKEPMDHILLFGQPGIGKTSLASVIAMETKNKFHVVQGPTLEKKSDLLSLVGAIKEGDIVFIDEIHSINSMVEEILYSLIDESKVDIMIGQNNEAKLVRIAIPKFTLIGATTKVNRISKPLHSRFGIIFKLKGYDAKDVKKLVINSAKVLGIVITDKAIEIVVAHSLLNPRRANNLLKRAIDFSIYKNKSEISAQILKKTLEAMGIYRFGLDELHIEYLKILENNFHEKWASIDSISSILKEDKSNIETNVEGALIELDFIEKSSRGRRLSNKGIKYINTYNLDNV